MASLEQNQARAEGLMKRYGHTPSAVWIDNSHDVQNPAWDNHCTQCDRHVLIELPEGRVTFSRGFKQPCAGAAAPVRAKASC